MEQYQTPNIPPQNIPPVYPQQPQAPQQSSQPRNRNTIVVVALVIVVVVLAGAMMYFVGKQDNGPQTGSPVENNNIYPGTGDNSNVPDQATATPPARATSTPPLQQPAPSANIAVFAGEWNGTYAASSLSSKTCPNGTESFSINNNGQVTGTVEVRGQNYPGNGTVDKYGNLSGTWRYLQMTVTFSGKLSGNSGNGTYRDNFGCYGTFSVSR